MKLLALLLAIVGGLAVGTQPLLNGALSRSRGVLEAVFVSITVSYIAVVLLLALKAMRGPLGLPFGPRPWFAAGCAAVLAALALALTARDVAPPYFVAGLLGIVVLLAGTAAAPILGVGATAAALTAGQLGAGIVLDQIGLLGLPEVPITPQRLLGVVLVMAGVILVRSF